MPGQIGNFVVSGHRTTYLAPFNKLGELRKGDTILIDTRTSQFVYKMTAKKIVQPSDVNVAAPVPEHPKANPTQRLITLTTCNPKYSAAQRLVIFGRLTSATPRVKEATT